VHGTHVSHLHPFPPREHSQLRNLHIPADHRVGRLFDCLTFPALHTVQLYPSTNKWPKTQFIGLLSRSSCTLQKLVWGTKSIFPIGDLLECLGSMQELRELQILDWSPDFSELLCHLTLDEGIIIVLEIVKHPAASLHKIRQKCFADFYPVSAEHS
jgi:hypothetical protein